MFWEAFSSLDFHYKVLAVVATLVTITSGTITIVWHIKTWHRRRLKLLKEYLEDREANVSDRRSEVLKKIANSLHKTAPAGEPNVSRAIENAIQLLDEYHVSAAQTELEKLQDRITEKLDFIDRYSEDLARHKANVHLMLAAIADRRDDASTGLKHVSEARSVLSDDVDLLKYEGLLHLKQGAWTEARDAFKRLEDGATGNEMRHYKAFGAQGRGDALAALRNIPDAIDAYDLALKRFGEAEPQHRDPILTGLVYLKLARLQIECGGQEGMSLARDHASSALAQFRSAYGLGVRAEDLRAAQQIKARAEAALAHSARAGLVN